MLVLGGCDLVIPLTEPPDVACGPYATIEPVMFAAEITEPSDFSIHYNGTQGMVHATVKVPASPNRTYTGPVPIVLDPGSGAWVIDPRFTNIDTFKLDGAHMLGDGSVFGWRDAIVATGAPPELNRFVFTSKWSVEATSQPLESDLSRNLRPGNEIVLPLENNGMLRFFTQIRVDQTGARRNQIEIRQKFVNQPWLATNQADNIAQAVRLDPSAAVMTADHGILVYAASDDGRKQRIFASRRDTEDQYEIGRQIDLRSSSDLDDSEPWIGERCETLYFRRGGVTYRAQ